MTKEERIDAIEEKMDTLSDLSCQVSEVATCLKDVGESVLRREALALEKAIDKCYEKLDDQRDELDQ